MSLLSASGLRCYTRASRLPTLAAANRLSASARYMSDTTEPEAPKAAETSKETTKAPTVPPGTAKMIHRKYFYGKRRPTLLKLSKEVQTAMTQRLPIVALETAIYTHGIPKPDNLKLAREVEETVRNNGAVPATIGILNGQIKIGMEPEELEELTESARSEKTAKISRRDITYRIAQLGEPLNGGTTIGGTLVLADLAGIRVFATGGLGGVHKGGESSLDISADLIELGRTPVSVISSGMKSFLDVARTLEVLETHGVFVSTFGKRGEKVEVPGFFSRESGYLSPNIIESPQEAANMIFHASLLKIRSGNLFFNPVPKEFEIPKSEMDPIIASAVEKASTIIGKDNTPAVLDEILKQSEGRSLQANWNLVLHNAKVGAQVAIELRKLEQAMVTQKAEEAKKHKSSKPTKQIPEAQASKTQPHALSHKGYKWKQSNIHMKKPTERRQYSTKTQPPAIKIYVATTPTPNKSPSISPEKEFMLWTRKRRRAKLERRNLALKRERDILQRVRLRAPQTQDLASTPQHGILVIGGVVVDRIGKVHAEKSQKFVSNPGTIQTSIGGVAKNIAVTIQNLTSNTPVMLVSAIGGDSDGKRIIRELEDLGMDVRSISILKKYRTACYMAINSDEVDGGLSLAVADMEILKNIPPSRATNAVTTYKPKIVCFDGNLSGDMIKQLCADAKWENAIVACEPTSAPKAADIAALLPQLHSSPNQSIDLISPNEFELNAMYETYQQHLSQGAHDGKKKSVYENLLVHYQDHVKKFTNSLPRIPTLPFIITQSTVLLPHIPSILLKLGSRGVLLIRLVPHPPNPTAPPTTDPSQTPSISASLVASQTPYTLQFTSPANNPESPTTSLFLPISHSRHDIAGLHLSYHPSLPVPGPIINSNGAGDTFFGTFLQSLLDLPAASSSDVHAAPWDYYHGVKLDDLIVRGQKFAVRCLTREESHGTREEADKELERMEGRLRYLRSKDGKVLRRERLRQGNVARKNSISRWVRNKS
ncbi:hypothetical protein ABW19_dt0209788 [Dactylella cylindrospora]|nr:hypothetical protein ABW19_dt0209788 [Dactylella cylindrospora]